MSESQTGLVGFSAQSLLRLKSRCQLSGLFLGDWEESASKFIQVVDNLVDCSCRTENPVSLLAVRWELPLDSRGISDPCT